MRFRRGIKSGYSHDIVNEGRGKELMLMRVGGTPQRAAAKFGFKG